MENINFKRTFEGTLETVIDRVTAALKIQGFGVLTRIDLHMKIKEKIGKDLPPAVILGACNPNLAYEAYVANPDVASLLPCNAVVREVGPSKFSVELARPSALMKILGDEKLISLAGDADRRLATVLETL